MSANNAPSPATAEEPSNSPKHETPPKQFVSDEVDQPNQMPLLSKLGIDNTQLVITEQYKDLQKSPLETIWGRLFFGTFDYFTPMVFKGFRKPLESEDVWRLPHTDEAEYLYSTFMKKYTHYVQKKKRPVIWSLASMFWLKFLIASVMKIWFDICNLSTPIVIRYLLAFLTRVKDSNQEAPWWEGLLYILLMVFLQANAIFFTQQYFHIVLRIGMNIRAILSVATYRKSLKVTTSVRARLTQGKITNLMSVDTQKVADVLNFLGMLYSAPIQIIWCIVALALLLYWPTAAGVGIMIILIPLQMFIFGKYAKLRAQSLKFTDSRIKQLSEVFKSIRIIKYFTYEMEYLKKITGIRRQEIIKIGKMNMARSFVGTLMSASPLMVSVSSFVLYALAYSDRLTAEVIFPSLSYFMLLRFPMVIFPMIISATLDANISMNRIESFLKEEERQPIQITKTQETAEYPIQFIDCDFEWEVPDKDESNAQATKKKKLFGILPLPFGRKSSKKQQKPSTDSLDKLEDKPAPAEDNAVNAADILVSTDNETEQQLDQHAITIEEKVDEDETSSTAKDRSFSKLTDISLKVKKGELVAIIGSVGSGKSSLLNALVGEMKKTRGDVLLGSSMAYAPQSAWIMNATVRDNILFYQQYDEEKLNRIIDVCALGPDIEIFEDGLLSAIGESGINISGGQKQRLNVARACYADRDVVVFDDVLSAVDPHVANHIFEKCILEYLEGKTRLLATHHIHLCERCDRILVMHEGRIVENGTYDELMKTEGGRFRKLSDTYLSKKEEEEEKEEIPEGDLSKAAASDGAETKKTVTTVPGAAPKEMMKKDERVRGTVSFKVILNYVRQMGGLPMVFFLAAAFLITQLALASGDWWLSEWSNNTFPTVNDNVYISLAIYAGLGIFAAFSTLIRDWTFYLAGLLASYRLHNDALRKLFRAPTAFFDTTPLGAILSRMSKDVEQTDSQIIIVLNSFFGTLCQVIAAVGMVAYVTRGVYLILVAIIMPIYIGVQQLYRKTSRELKRLDSISRSPMYAHFSETLTGISTIRAYRQEMAFQQVNSDRVDLNLRPFFAQLIAQRWLAFRLESLGAILVCGAAAIVMLLSYFDWFDVSASRAGLAIVYSMTLTNVLSWSVRQFVEAETQFNAVERLVYYAESLPHEKSEASGERPPQTWPRGDIVFDNYQMRYREELPLVLKGVNLHVKEHETVGIVGRTGSGKSSLLVALFRLVESAGGRILIDGFDISKVALRQLREAICIIPQEPILLSGTIRSSLDPFHNHSDESIWTALEKASMKDTIENMGGLTTVVSEGGDNFSVGERQLLCLARALLKKANILILDEASSSIDVESDAHLQRTIREEFTHNCTILTIAHRLSTICDNDKILVMDDGRVAEFDSPTNLLKRKDSIFRSMVKEMGPSASKKLFETVLGESEAMNHWED